jgi:hypothetical protein
MEITVQACVDRHFAEDWQAVWVETASNCIRI